MQESENNLSNEKIETNEQKTASKPRRSLKFLLFLFAVIIILGLAKIYYVRHEGVNSHAELDSASHETIKQVQGNDATQPQEASRHAELDSASQEALLIPHETLNQVQGDSGVQHDKINPQNFNNYRYYLWNFGLLINNFLQDKEFSQELAYITAGNKKLNIPPNVNKTILQLEEYNNTYLVKEAPPMEVFPKKPGWLEKLVKIQKHPSNLHSRQQLKKEISSNLDNIINFVYSEEAQLQFISDSREQTK